MRGMCLGNSRLRKLCGELQVETDRKGVKQRLMENLGVRACPHEADQIGRPGGQSL